MVALCLLWLDLPQLQALQQLINLQSQLIKRGNNMRDHVVDNLLQIDICVSGLRLPWFPLY